MSDRKCSCAASQGKQSINEACGGCCTCLELQNFHVMDTQQQKIDKLESLLREAVTALRVVQDVEKKEGDHYFIVDSFLNNPEIKKIRGEE